MDRRPPERPSDRPATRYTTPTPSDFISWIFGLFSVSTTTPPKVIVYTRVQRGLNIVVTQRVVDEYTISEDAPLDDGNGFNTNRITHTWRAIYNNERPVLQYERREQTTERSTMRIMRPVSIQLPVDVSRPVGSWRPTAILVHSGLPHNALVAYLHQMRNGIRENRDDEDCRAYDDLVAAIENETVEPRRE